MVVNCSGADPGWPCLRCWSREATFGCRGTIGTARILLARRADIAHGMWLGRRSDGVLLKRFDLCLYFLQTGPPRFHGHLQQGRFVGPDPMFGLAEAESRDMADDEIFYSARLIEENEFLSSGLTPVLVLESDKAFCFDLLYRSTTWSRCNLRGVALGACR